MLDVTGEETPAPEPEEDTLADLLTGAERKASDLELIVQRMIRVLAGEYHFPLETIGRDVTITVSLDGKNRKKRAELVVYGTGVDKDPPIERIVSIRRPGTKPTDRVSGLESLEDLMDAVGECEFGLWTNGRDVAYLQKKKGALQSRFVELSDFPGAGERLDDLDRPDRRIARIAVAEDLRETVLRCHDYLYGNQSMTANRAFAEMLKLIFCKIYDERQLRARNTYQRQFWVGVTERNDTAGQQRIATRIRELFAQVKRDRDLRDIFKPADEVELEPRQLAWVSSELARYQFLDAEVDVKGLAYEAMVAMTMKKERGQFFTPRNVVEAMVAMLDPKPEERVLDPACGSGRFLVACLDRYRNSRATELAGAAAGEVEMRRLRNSDSVLGEAAAYARSCLVGVDLDPELQRAARMNMLINNDGHGSIFSFNSLSLTRTDLSAGAVKGAELVGFETFDIVLTNPPFGANIPVDDPDILRNFELAHRWDKTPDGSFAMRQDDLQSKMPPEILFIERCMQWLREGGRMGIVLPDGILGNPDTEYIRYWILQHSRILASVDLPVEAFLPQVGVQASLLFLQKRPAAEVRAGVQDEYPIFMAVVEFVGHDRRGNTIYRRDPDGFEIFANRAETLEVRRGGESVVEMRTLRMRVPADDLPSVASRYRRWRDTGSIESNPGPVPARG
ncbi:restriction endonuclease subunit M [bacterium]|nr:MAG: restriction endonuclease subunit M [bacterium]